MGVQDRAGDADAHRQHWHALSHAEQSGLGDYEIASACALSVEMVRAILGERTK